MAPPFENTKTVISIRTLCTVYNSRLYIRFCYCPLTAVSRTHLRSAAAYYFYFEKKMAALRINIAKSVTKQLLSGCNGIAVRSKSTKVLTTALGTQSNVEKVVTTSDGTFVAWHPTPDFPYEHSRPLPPPAIATSTLLKDDAIQTAMQAFGNKHPEIAQQELMRVTHSSKHIWAPRQRDKKIRISPPDREYL